MFPMFNKHPSLETLSEFTGATTSSEQARVAEHLASCAECRSHVQYFRAASEAVRQAETPTLPADLRERVWRSRVNGTRVILPVNDLASTRRSARTTRWVSVAAGVAAVAVMMFGQAIWSTGHEARAGSTAGTLTMSPALPRPGQSFEVSYLAPDLFSSSSALVVRARLRSAHGSDRGVATSVRVVARLTHQGGNRYTTRITLPDSIVYAALVVEDSAGALVDDNNRHLWEALTTLNGSTPSFESLNQRAHDLMGRNFEEAHATARRMVRLYPDSVGGWSWLRSFENWLGLNNVDSLRAAHQSALARIDRHWRTVARPDDQTIGELAWYSSRVDTAAYHYWRQRLMREAPTNSFALQWRMLEVMDRMRTNHDTVDAFASLDTLWAQSSFDRAIQIATEAEWLAARSARPERVEAWSARLMESADDPLDAEMHLADNLVNTPALARLGVEHLHHVLASIPSASGRQLTENVTEFRARMATQQRRALATLGHALIASGATRAGLDTLTLAASAGWDMSVIQSLRDGSFTAGDSATGWQMTARLLADPTTDEKLRDSLNATATRSLGAERWSALRQQEVGTFVERIMATSRTQSVSKSAQLRDTAGRVQSLRDVGAGRVTVVAFFSRDCGWALNDLANLNRVAQRLEQSGAQLLLVIDDEAALSPGLTSFLTEKHVKAPVYFDVDHSVSATLANWETPAYFILDRDTRSRFTSVHKAREAFVLAEALRQAEVSRMAKAGQ